MSKQTSDLKPLFLSHEEALCLLDLCMMSDAEFDRDKQALLLKLSDVVRQHLAPGAEEIGDVTGADGDDPRHEPNGAMQDDARYAENGRLLLSGAEIVSAHTNAVRGSALKPCPAGRFRSWTGTSGL